MKRNDDSLTRLSQQTRQVAEMAKRCTPSQTDVIFVVTNAFVNVLEHEVLLLLLPLKRRLPGITFTRSIWIAPIDWWLPIRTITRMFQAVPVATGLPIIMLTRLIQGVPNRLMLANQNVRKFGLSCHNQLTAN